MRCFINDPSARKDRADTISSSFSSSSIMSTARVVLVCLLATASLIGVGDAARTPQQRREQRNPYLMLPPGLEESFAEGEAARDLGEREFVRSFCGLS